MTCTRLPTPDGVTILILSFEKSPPSAFASTLRFSDGPYILHGFTFCKSAVKFATEYNAINGDALVFPITINVGLNV